MTNQQVLKKTEEYVKKILKKDTTGHDFFHISRVVKLSKQIANKERGDLFIIELAALLHDIADWKFHKGDLKAGPTAAREWLDKLKVDQRIVKAVVEIVEKISFKGGTNKRIMKSVEGKIVQDADRLDAMGAVGIARVFATGSYLGRRIYDPDKKLKDYKTFSSFKAGFKKSTSINHFYEKLLLLKDKMNTKIGKKIAQERHILMEEFLKQFYKEWQANI